MRNGILFHELLDILYIQSTLVDQGCLLRGSVTIGSILVKNGFVFGPALIRAYKLENEIANYPRIIIDPIVFDYFDKTHLLKADQHDHKMEKSYLKPLLRLDADGIWYLDYLRGIQTEFDDNAGYIDLLMKHKNMISLKSKKIIHLDRLAVKYTWLACYHNGVVNELKEDMLKPYDLTKKDLLVTSKDIKPMYKL